MNHPYGLPIPDVQSGADDRRIAIDRVGIKSIRHPMRIAGKGGGVQHTIGVFNMHVQLRPERKGACHVCGDLSGHDRRSR
jgi:GTP cyclohydrolase I